MLDESIDEMHEHESDMLNCREEGFFIFTVKDFEYVIRKQGTAKNIWDSLSQDIKLKIKEAIINAPD